ncbi:MAG: tryptophan synthase subunit alpha [Planctomycetaceae bacterium]
MSRIAEVFQSASRAQRMTFMPFVTAGDPSTEGTAAVLKALRDADVDLIELGFPYSDPIADGPVIQASYTRALDSGVTVSAILDMMTSLKNDNLPPVLAMVSFAIIFRFGSERFVKLAAESGFSGLIIPDLPADEAEDIQALARKRARSCSAGGSDDRAGPSSADSERLHGICLLCVGGRDDRSSQRTAAGTDPAAAAAAAVDVPSACGGIRDQWTDQVPALQGVADGVIVGSAIVRQISEAPTVQAACDRVREFSQAMRTAVGSVKPSLVSTT